MMPSYIVKTHYVNYNTTYNNSYYKSDYRITFELPFHPEFLISPTHGVESPPLRYRLEAGRYEQIKLFMETSQGGVCPGPPL